MGVVTFPTIDSIKDQVNAGYSMWDTYNGTVNYLNDLKPGTEFATSLKGLDFIFNVGSFIYSQTTQFAANPVLAELKMAAMKPADKQNGAKPGGALAETSEPAGQEFIYSSRVSLDETQMQIEDKMVNLAPGMAVTVEVKTGTRRIIEYLMSPLLRYRQESLRER